MTSSLNKRGGFCVNIVVINENAPALAFPITKNVLYATQSVFANKCVFPAKFYAFAVKLMGLFGEINCQ